MVWDKIRQGYRRLRGQHVEYSLRPYQRVLQQIDAQTSVLRDKTDRELQALAAELRQRSLQGTPVDSLLAKAFALGREAAARVLDMRPYDVQMLAGIALYQGKLVEMQTGEGKTLAAVLPATLSALTGKGVHVLTFNDYLARRDAQWMGPIYAFLGLTVGYIQEGMPRAERREAYARDITYATAREVGFDYLRDQLCQQESHLVQRGYHYAIVDEADSLLIDEARIPLVIAASDTADRLDLYQVAALIRPLVANQHYDLDDQQHNAFFTDVGFDALEAQLYCDSLHSHRNLDLLTRLHLALQAQILFQRDRDYIVREGKIELVDAFTGRAALDRQWPYGLQAAVEAKEGLEIQPEGMIRNSITLIHFMKYYQKLAAMTATAQVAAEELYEFYKLPTVVIPPHKPCIRIDHPDLLFGNRQAKEKALVTEITKVHATGRPILVGTSSIAESEHLADLLKNQGVSCQVLNAKEDAKEALIVARAGNLEAVTISTNMAGRGTDIKLGEESQTDYDKVCALGGLYVIGTNRHESRRIDDQLRGRAGRQGDPGSSRFFVSLDDDLMVRYGLVDFLPQRVKDFKCDKPLSNRTLHDEIERAQRIIEDQNFQVRHTLWRYAKMVEDQRAIFTRRRRSHLKGDPLPTFFKEHFPAAYQDLCAQVSTERLAQVENKIILYHMDKNWSYYMAQVDLLRKFVHIPSLDGCSSLDTFHRTLIHAFGDMWAQVEKDIGETLQHLQLNSDQDDLLFDLPKDPSATWTYVINDNPLGGHAQRFRKRVKEIFKEKLLGKQPTSP